ncbi:hypothetical protein U9M48_034040 [Paspalum notatum var. saurae]|uniref:Uncharacterized protein n=1 Tax=Paspalum notatum var. saurae TaxID=547442 RepID=A0AAQ3X769_PASNO
MHVAGTMQVGAPFAVARRNRASISSQSAGTRPEKLTTKRQFTPLVDKHRCCSINLKKRSSFAHHSSMLGDLDGEKQPHF